MLDIENEGIVGKMRDIFIYILFITAIFIISLLSWELFMQLRRPEFSFLKYIQDIGYMQNTRIVVEPNKGIWHPLGWIGSFFMITMLLYSIRKRFRLFHNMGNLYSWLNAHIMLGILGPILVTFHTTFKLGGLVAVSFWCMVLVAMSGIFGRYIFLKIPRGISGHELEISEVEDFIQSMTSRLENVIPNSKIADEFIKKISQPKKGTDMRPIATLFYLIRNDFANLREIGRLKQAVSELNYMSRKDKREVIGLIKKKAKLIRGVNFLVVNQSLLNYWHIFHIPLTIIMFLVMLLHIGIYFLFKTGY